ncbi:hypothetical protein TNCV_4505471 [Trichonephila clavipes]|nr:hypothetical protein TNCV_4505471 [Trichonephila clavipes]
MVVSSSAKKSVFRLNGFSSRKNAVDDLLGKVDDMIKANRSITIDGAAEELGIGHKEAQKLQNHEFFFGTF